MGEAFSEQPPSWEKAGPSPLEWLPAAALAVLAIVFLCVATPGGTWSRFCLYVGLGLVPGLLWRLTGRSSWHIHRVCFAAALVAFVLANPQLRPDAETFATLSRHWPLALLGFAVSFTQPVWGMLRTRRLLTDSGVAISRLETLRLSLCGTFFNIFLPGSTGGDAYRVYAITRERQTSVGPTIASITLDRVLGLPSLILVVALGMALDYRFFRANAVLAKFVPFIGAAGAVCVGLVAYLALAGKQHRRVGTDATGNGAAASGRGGWFRRLHGMIAANVTRPATLPLALFYGLCAHLACVFSCLLFGMAVGVEGVPPLRYFLIVPMAMTVNAIPFSPGGVGQGEFAMATLLDLASPHAGNLQNGVMVMVLFRLSNIVLGIIGGVLYAIGKRQDGSRACGSRPECAAFPRMGDEPESFPGKAG